MCGVYLTNKEKSRGLLNKCLGLHVQIPLLEVVYHGKYNNVLQHFFVKLLNLPSVEKMV
jgi:hypothetical protein